MVYVEKVDIIIFTQISFPPVKFFYTFGYSFIL